MQAADLTDDETGRADEGIVGILARAGDPLRPETNPFANHFLERALRPAIVPYPRPAAATTSSPLSTAEILWGSIIGVALGVTITLFTIGKVPFAGNIEESDSTAAAPFAARFDTSAERRL